MGEVIFISLFSMQPTGQTAGQIRTFNSSKTRSHAKCVPFRGLECLVLSYYSPERQNVAQKWAYLKPKC